MPLALLAVTLPFVRGTAPARAATGAPSPTAGTAPTPRFDGPALAEAVPGELLVAYRPGVSEAARAATASRHGATVLRRFPEIGVELVGLPAAAGLAAAAAGFDAERGVRYAEPNYRVHADDQSPNDPFFGQQWGEANTGQAVLGVSGTPGDDVSATSAWGVQTGSPSVTVAVVDTGVDTGHPDLAANVDATDAFNFLDGTHVVYDPAETCGFPNDDHGTHVSGILGAVGDNGTGVAGVAWRVRILPLKVLGVQNGQCGVGDDAHAISAILYAVRMGATLVNISWGGETAPNESLRQAMIQAGQAGVLFSVAAGNASADLGTSTDYPSSFGLANEIVVAASDQSDHLASFSNRGGPTALAAPGVDILSTVTRAAVANSSNPPYGYLSGTSMSAPFVTGALALLRSQYPGATPAELRSRLLTQVDPRIALASPATSSGGRLNVFHALTQVLGVVPTITSPAGGEVYGPMTTQTATWQTNVPGGNPETPYRVELTADATASTTYSETFAGPGLPSGFTQPAGSDKPWSVALGAGPGGSNAMRSGLVPGDDNKASWVATTVSLSVPGTVAFSYRVDSEDCTGPSTPVCGDYLQFFVDGVSVLMVNGHRGYTPVSFPVSAGVHTLSWAYQKDMTTSVGADAAWIAGLSVTGIDDARWTTVATTAAGATSAPWAVPSQPTRSARLRVCQDTGGPCAPAVASATPGLVTISLVLVRPATVSVAEGSAVVGVAVSLLTPPIAPVTINLSPDPQLSVSPSSLVFTSAGAAQQVSVAAPDDGVAQPASHTVSIQVSSASNDPAYSGAAIEPVPVTIADADTAGVAVDDGGGLTLVPGGPAGSYTVVLTSRPAGTVSVALSPDPALAVSPSRLTFDAGDWSAAQTVSVSVPAAGRVFGARTVAVGHAVSSADPAYDQIPVAAARVHLAPPPPTGYWLVASDGGIFAFGGVRFLGSTGGLALNKPIVAAMESPTGLGYWLAASDGGIFSFGDALFRGSTGALHLNKPIVAAMETPTGLGYWLVASDGGIFSFGDAVFLGSTGGLALNKPIVAAMETPTGLGYWLVASDGGIFSFGDAVFQGSTGSLRLNQPVAAAVPTPTGLGYWLVASDGGLFSFGDAVFHGSTGSLHLNKPIVAAMETPTGLGYWLVASDGGIFSFGDARFFGSTGSIHLNRPIVAALAR